MTTGRINQVAAGLTGRGPAKAAGQGLARAAQYGSETSLGFNTGEVSAANGAGVNGSASAPRKGVGQTTYLLRPDVGAKASSMKAFACFLVSRCIPSTLFDRQPRRCGRTGERGGASSHGGLLPGPD